MAAAGFPTGELGAPANSPTVPVGRSAPSPEARTEGRTEEAEVRTEAAEVRTEEAEVRTEEAEVRTEEAQAEPRMSQVRAR